MKQDRIFGRSRDEFYTNSVSSLLSEHSGVMEYKGDGYAEGQKSNGVTPGEFINVGDKRYFVKYPTLDNKEKSYRIFTELFISFLAKSLGVNCIDCKLFIDDELEAIGVASPDFGNNRSFDELGINIKLNEDNYLQTIMQELSVRYYKLPNFDINPDKVYQQLKIISCLDFLTLQADRHSANLAITILKTGDNWQVDLAPLFDNAECLSRQSSILYKLVPMQSKYGTAQRELMNSDDYFIKFYNKFKLLASAKNFNYTMQKFEDVYGLQQLFCMANQGDKYRQIVEEARKSINEQIEFCDGFARYMQ